jgi:hypothetical protein
MPAGRDNYLARSNQTITTSNMHSVAMMNATVTFSFLSTSGSLGINALPTKAGELRGGVSCWVKDDDARL